ncbi:zinc finger protein 260 [Halyomorpha halys]|uniref:zinc finger protein 260 n=1 Tax=Halyomorpha halys TaxID=286706 RepID=UPI0006D4D1DD|nr:oocyte zinc finger protein XlCOF6-like [Halyomorpha halys]
MECDKEEKCRLCMSYDITEESIFDTREDGFSLSAKIMICTSLMVSAEDQYSKYICSNCADMLDLFFHFRNTCFKTYMTMYSDLGDLKLQDGTTIIGIQDDSAEFEDDYANEKYRLKDSMCSFRNKEDDVSTENADDLGIDKVVSEEIVFDERETKEMFTERQFQVGCYVSLTGAETENEETDLLRRFKCTSCKKVFSSLNELDNHWDMCVAFIENNLQIRDLISADQSDENMLYDDEIVEESGNDEESCTVKKSNKAKEFCCETCGQVFKQLWLLTRHIQVKHIGVRPFSCPHCPRKFYDKYELKYHQRLHEDVEDFCCNVCGRRFARRSGLRAHMRSHTGEKPFDCRTCGKSFAHLNSLATHERIHTGERPYTCKYCQRTFAQYSTARSHEEMHMGGLRMHQCDVCDRMYKTEKELRAHTIGHEGSVEHHCLVCGKGFKKLTELKNHQQRHHVEKKPYACDHCSKSYMSSRELRAHMTLHTGELPYTCLFCSKRYRLKATLRKHMDKHHKGTVPADSLDPSNINLNIF